MLVNYFLSFPDTVTVHAFLVNGINRIPCPMDASFITQFEPPAVAIPFESLSTCLAADAVVIAYPFVVVASHSG
jgi:hypothetical protein